MATKKVIYTVEMTNEFFGTARPSWKYAERISGQARSIFRRYNEYRARSGGCDTAARVVSPAGATWSDIEDSHMFSTSY